MKIFLNTIAFSFIQLSVFSQQIEFFNVGLQDKPLDNIIVSKRKNQKDDFIKNIVVTNDVYYTIKQYVLNNNTYKQPLSCKYDKNKDGRSGSYDFGCYAVQISEERNHLLYFMDSN